MHKEGKTDLRGDLAGIFDVDDSLVDRTRAVRRVSEALSRFKNPSVKAPSFYSLPRVNRPVDIRPVRSPLEMVALVAHAQRKAIPGVAENLQKWEADGIGLYGNTGRSSKKVWMDMTRKSLAREGIFLNSIFHTPEGVRTAISKADGIRRVFPHYRRVKYFDDDKWTVITQGILFRDFPQVEINYIHYQEAYVPLSAKRFMEDCGVNVIPIDEWENGYDIYASSR